ncbi:MAG: peptidase U32 family protein [Oscillibacter sp.]
MRCPPSSGGAAATRGACAQPCRLPYGFSGRADGHPLSLKDANLAPFVPEMMDMGVACLKIEGRMKRPEYVAAVMEIYARLLREHRTPTKDEQKKLALAFSRDGFTEGYYRGVRGHEMFGTRPENARWPEDWFSEIRARYEKENLRLVPLTLECTIRAGEPMHLTAEDADGHAVTVTGAVPEAARSRAVTAGRGRNAPQENRRHRHFRRRIAPSHSTAALPSSAGALNALRREAFAQMEAQRTAVPKRRVFDFVPPTIVKNSTDKPLLTVSLHRAEQLSEELVALAPARVYVPVEAAAPARPFTTSRQNRIFRGACRASTAHRTILFCARCSRTPPKRRHGRVAQPTSAISRSCADLIASCTAAGR